MSTISFRLLRALNIVEYFIKKDPLEAIRVDKLQALPLAIDIINSHAKNGSKGEKEFLSDLASRETLEKINKMIHDWPWENKPELKEIHPLSLRFRRASVVEEKKTWLEKVKRFLSKMAWSSQAFCFEMLATFWCIVLTPLAFIRLDPGKKHANNSPILLVHGYLHNKSGFALLHWRLREENLGPIYSLNLTPPFSSIEHFASLVKERAAEIEKETGKKELIIIGHSMGGVVAAFYAEYIAPEGKVSDIITIASPLKGTPLAYLGVGACCRQMQINSDLIRALYQRIKHNRQLRYHHMSSKVDSIVPASYGLIGEYLERERIYPDISHAGFFFSKKVASQIIEWLRQAKLKSPKDLL